MSQSNLKSIASRILREEGQELIDAADRNSESIVNACDLIVKHPGKVVILGMGKSGLIAQKIAATLCSIGNKAVFLHAAEASAACKKTALFPILHNVAAIFCAINPDFPIPKITTFPGCLTIKSHALTILSEFRSAASMSSCPSSRRIRLAIDFRLD